MGKVYMRLVLSTLYSWEDYADAILRVYNDKILIITGVLIMSLPII